MWQDQGRQHHGWFGNGTSPYNIKDAAGMFGQLNEMAADWDGNRPFFFITCHSPGCTRSISASRIEAEVTRIARTPFAELQIVAANGTDFSPVWATWSEGTLGRRHAVHLALITRRVGRVRQVWSDAWRDGYEPLIQRVWSWQYHGRPSVALVYQMGAAAQVLKVYGLSQRNSPKLLGETVAAFFEFSIGSGQFTIVAHGDPPDPLRCLRLDTTPRLRDAACPARP